MTEYTVNLAMMSW